MYLDFLLRGIAAGFLIAAPVGPVNVLCMRRTIGQGRRAGFISGLGAASADAFYGAIAAFGLKFIADILLNQQDWLQIAGGLFICAIGIKTFFAKPPHSPHLSKKLNHAGAFASTFFLTLTNPTTIISFGAIFAWMGLASARENHIEAEMLVLGVFVGSALWWLVLSLGIGAFRKQITKKILHRINQVAGAIILFFGIVALVFFGS